MQKKLLSLLLLFTSFLVQASIFKPLANKKIHPVAPANGASSLEWEALKKIKDLPIVFPTDCFDNTTFFHAASDEKRFECLKKAIYDPTTDIIWCLRGGYGTAKLIDQLMQLPQPASQKLFVGYSDITALHLFFTQQWGWQTLHGAMLMDLTKTQKSTSSIQKLVNFMSGQVQALSLGGLLPLNEIAKTTGPIVGKLTGGNLTIVQTSIGTNWAIEARGKILFLEDTHMLPYQLDRSLLHLEQAGIFKGVLGIILGTFNKEDAMTSKILEQFARRLTIPIFKTNQFGHENLNDPILYNVTSIIVGKGNHFELLMPAHVNY